MKEKILVALDGSDCGNRALEKAVNHAKLTDSSLILAYIIDWSPYSFNTPEENEQRHKRRESEISRAQASILDPEASALEKSGLEIKTVVRHGKIAPTLVHLTTEHDVSQIYIGRIGESRMQSMIFGSVTVALVQASPVPVTVVP